MLQLRADETAAWRGINPRRPVFKKSLRRIWGAGTYKWPFGPGASAATRSTSRCRYGVFSLRPRFPKDFPVAGSSPVNAIVATSEKGNC